LVSATQKLQEKVKRLNSSGARMVHARTFLLLTVLLVSSSGAGVLGEMLPLDLCDVAGGPLLQGCPKWSLPVGGRLDALAISPEGKWAVVGGPNGLSAIDAETGVPLWEVATLSYPVSLMVTPDGAIIVVAGNARSGEAFVTEGYDATTGTLLWTNRMVVGGGTYERTARMAMAMTGDVYVVGNARRLPGSWEGDGVVIAIDVGTGVTRWVSKVQSEGGAWAQGVSVAPDGRYVYVTGGTDRYAGPPVQYRMWTAAYNASTGIPAWTTQDEPPLPSPIAAGIDVDVTADGATVYVLGDFFNHLIPSALRLVAYRAEDGTPMWAQSIPPPDGGGAAYATDVMVAQGQPKVFVSGYVGTLHGTGSLLAAFEEISGAPLWLDIDALPSDTENLITNYRSYYLGLVEDPAHDRVHAFGMVVPSQFEETQKALVRGYNRSTGARLWSAELGTYALASAAAPSEMDLLVAGNDYGRGVLTAFVP
jgi:outer membrane protein assembly factor BamB